MGRASKKGITGDFDIVLRSLCLATTLSVAITPLITEVGFSRPVFPASQYPQVPNNNLNVPVCYIQTTDGRTLDLQKLCGNSSVKTINNSLSSRIPKGKFRRGSGSGYASDNR